MKPKVYKKMTRNALLSIDCKNQYRWIVEDLSTGQCGIGETIKEAWDSYEANAGDNEHSDNFKKPVNFFGWRLFK